MTQELFASLNPAQREAVGHVEGPLLILAGPGSGKTRVVTHRIAHLLGQGIAPQQLLALTFTNKAADEMSARVGRLVPGRPVWMGTFHRFCARLLRQYAPLVGLKENFSIYDAQEAAEALKQALADAGVQINHLPPAQIGSLISQAKNELILPEEYARTTLAVQAPLIARIYDAYRRRLLHSNAVDFDDLLLHVALLLQQQPELRAQLDAHFRYVMVDEYQDTNRAQYAILRALSRDFPNLAATGDPDQSIYGWRGATLRNILDFEQDFPGVRVVRLEQNYRSTQAILRTAARLISFNRLRKDKRLITENVEGRPVRLVFYPTSSDESQTIAARIANEVQGGRRRARDFAIFYRANYLSRSLEQALRNVGLPYQIVKGLEFYQRKEIKDVLAYLQLLNNPRHDVAFLRIVNTPPRGIGLTTLRKLTDLARRQRLSLLEAAGHPQLPASIRGRAAAGLAAFAAMYDRWSPLATAPLEEVISTVLADSGYRAWLVDGGTEEDEERLQNVDELVADARDFDQRHPAAAPLEAFLEQAALVADTDALQLQQDCVTLMTLHSAKGLEFPVVFIVAVEEKILPHERSMAEASQLEEERRLLFVGITRAREECHLSLAEYRHARGVLRPSVPSSFLAELPRDELELVTPTRRTAHARPPRVDVEGWDESLDEFPRPAPASKPVAPRVSPTAVRTAAEMLAGAAPSQPLVAPEEFAQGMVVMHPQYGPGTIVALSGEGRKRTATVRFFGPDGQKKFLLIHSPLRPVQSTK